MFTKGGLSKFSLIIRFILVCETKFAMPRFVADLSTISRFVKIRFTTTGFAISKLCNPKEVSIPPK